MSTGKFSGVLLASDFDDTLYGTDGSVSHANRQAISYFIANGGFFTVATGRARKTFAPYAGLAPINAPVILSNGAALYDFQTQRLLQLILMPDQVRGHLSRTAQEIPSLGFEAYHEETVYLHNPNEVTWSHLRQTNVGDGVFAAPISEMPLPWHKVILEQDRPTLERVRQFINRNWPGQYELIFSNNFLLEMTCKGVNKGGMVRALADRLGVAPQHIYCVGDNENDLPMLQVSAIPFAPANCADVVKAFHPRLVRSCDEDCIADIIQILDGIY